MNKVNLEWPLFNDLNTTPTHMAYMHRMMLNTGAQCGEVEVHGNLYVRLSEFVLRRIMKFEHARMMCCNTTVIVAALLLGNGMFGSRV